MAIPGLPQKKRYTLEGSEAEDPITLSRRVEVHDDTHVELKIGYGLPETGREVQYEVEVYFFFPGSLDVNALTLPKRYFYNDLRCSVRYKTPTISLEALLAERLFPPTLDLDPESMDFEYLDEETQESPLTRLLKLSQRETRAQEPEADWLASVLDEIKLFGCFARVYMRNKKRRLKPFLALAQSDPYSFYDRNRLEDSVLRFLGKAQALLRHFRRVRRLYQKLDVEPTPKVFRAFDQVDEYLSFQLEKYFCRLLEEIEREDALVAERIRPHLVAALTEEAQHREREQYHSSPQSNSQNEHFTHHLRLLKKYVGSALYLDQQRTIPDQLYSNWVGALAAGLAMFFASVASILLGIQSLRLDLSVLALIVLVYIFKDRIKDLVKRRMEHDGFGIFADIDSAIVDSTRGLTLGRCWENIRWVEAEELPPLVERVRSFRSKTHRDLRAATGETVLRYNKTVSLDREVIHANHHRRGDLNDIIRISLARFRRHMDVPVMELATMNLNTGRLEKVEGRKTYAINMVIRYTLSGQDAHYEKLRVILDKEGLERVETVVPPLREEDLKKMGSTRSVEEWIRASYSS